MATIGRLNVTECDIKWRIEDFLSYTEDKDTTDEIYFSPSFSFAGVLWCLKICPNGDRDKSIDEYVSLYLLRKSSGPPITIEYSFGLQDSILTKVNENNFSNVFEDENSGYGMAKFILINEIQLREKRLVPCGVLSVLCTLKSQKSIENVGDNESAKCCHCKETFDEESISLHEKKCLVKCPECSAVVVLQSWYDHECCQTAEAEDENSLSSSSLSPYKNKILQDFKELFHKREDCDVIIRVKGEELPAHRVILKARSPVFASTFQSDMKEKATGIVDIEDCSPSIFSDFLYFLYCESVDNLSEGNVFSLFTVADKYDVPDLRAKCIEFMKVNLSVDTFCETITLALRHSETQLIHVTTNFFIKNAQTIVETVEWQSFLAENPTQSNELFIKFIENVSYCICYACYA